MGKTFWFDLIFFEPAMDAIPGLLMYVEVKNAQEVATPEGTRLRVGHDALRASDLERNVETLKRELDAVVAEARRRDAAYHNKLTAKPDFERQR